MPRKRQKKSSFVMHLKFRSSLKDLTDEEYREIVEAMFSYTETRVRPTFSNRVLEVAFNSIQDKMDEDYDSWKETCDNRSKAKQERDAQKRVSQDTTIVTKGHNCEPSEQLPQDTTNASDNEYDYDYEYDYEYDLYNGVCGNKNNARARETENFCHLGDIYKTTACFNCKKKYKCSLEESPDFKLKHPNETFNEWNAKKIEQQKILIQEMKARGQPVDMSIFDYDWLNEP